MIGQTLAKIDDSVARNVWQYTFFYMLPFSLSDGMTNWMLLQVKGVKGMFYSRVISRNSFVGKQNKQQMIVFLLDFFSLIHSSVSFQNDAHSNSFRRWVFFLLQSGRSIVQFWLQFSWFWWICVDHNFYCDSWNIVWDLQLATRKKKTAVTHGVHQKY